MIIYYGDVIYKISSSVCPSKAILEPIIYNFTKNWDLTTSYIFPIILSK